MRIPIKLTPEKCMQQYNLYKLEKMNKFTYRSTEECTPPPLQARILVNKLLCKQLALYGYYEVKHTPGLWRFTICPIKCTLVVDNFGVKYTAKRHLQHLIRALKETYELSIDYGGSLYYAISLKWDY